MNAQVFDETFYKDEMLGWHKRYLQTTLYMDQLTAAIAGLRVRFERARRDRNKAVWYNIHIRLMTYEGILNALIEYANVCIDEMHRIRIYQNLREVEADRRSRHLAEMAESGMTQSE